MTAPDAGSPTPGSVPDTDAEAMARAIALAATVRRSTSPNPWVGALVEPGGFGGATSPPGGPHAEVVALQAAGLAARGATLYVTLEPCAHQGRTPPCVAAIIDSDVARVVVGVEDPDPQVSGKGIAELRAAGIKVDVGVGAGQVNQQLAPYLKHRSTGRPWVVLKMACTLDGRTAAADGTSRWITGEEARADAHQLRADSDAVLVGAGTVRADDPSLTVRHGVVRPDTVDLDTVDLDTVGPRNHGPRNHGPGQGSREPLRVVLGHAPEGARVHPALELTGDLGDVLDHLGGLGVLQVLVEGGPRVAGDFHRAGLVDRYVLYLAPALSGGDRWLPVMRGDGAPSVADLWRGRLVSVQRLGDDLRVELAPDAPQGQP